MPVKISDAQIGVFRRINEAWPRYVRLAIQEIDLKGGMGFKKVNGIEYLVRYWQDEATGKKRFNSLGRRSRETDRTLSKFLTERARVKMECADLKGEIELDCRVARAHRLARVPARIGFGFRALDFAMADTCTLLTAGAAAVHAYEIEGLRRMEGSIVAHGEQAPLRFVHFGPIDDDDVEALLLCFGVDPVDTLRSHSDGVTHFLAPDGVVVELFDRRCFSNGSGREIRNVAVSRDASAAPMSCVPTDLWLEIESRYPSADRASSARIDFVDQIRMSSGNDFAFRV